MLPETVCMCASADFANTVQEDGRGMAFGSATPTVTRLMLNVEGYIVGYHVYKRIWSPVIDEVATAVRDEDNIHDHYAVAILEEDTCCTVGHIPRKISKECYFFLKTGGSIKVKVTGQRRRSDLPQGGLEIPCLMMLEHDDEKVIRKARQLLEQKGFHEAETSEAQHEEQTPNSESNDNQTVHEKTQSKHHGKRKSTVTQKGRSKKQKS